MALFNILVDIAARTASFESALGHMDERLKQWGENVKHIVEVIAGGSLIEFGKKIIEAGDKMHDAALKANVSAEAFSQLTYAAKLSGVSMDSLSSDLLRMERNLSLASTGTKIQNDALGALGLTYNELKNLKPEAQFEILADRISKLKDPADRARAEMTLFGRSGGDLAALMDKGAKGIRALREEAERIGNSFSKEQLDALDETNDSIDRMEASFTGLATTLIAKVSPALTKFFDQITTAISNDKLNGLKNYIELLKTSIEHSEKFGLTIAEGTGGLSLEEAKKRLNASVAQLRLMTGGYQTHSRGEINTDTQAPPGFQPDELSEFVVNRQKLTAGGNVNPILAQWEESTRRALDSANTEFYQTEARLTGMLQDNAITAEEFNRRLDMAKQKYNDAIDISPVIVSTKKVLDNFISDSLQRVKDFRSDFENALQGAAKSGGNFGKNFLKGLLQALEDRAIFKAIAAIGSALEDVLSKHSGGVLGSILANIFGGIGSSGGYTQAELNSVQPVTPTVSRLPGYAMGGSFNVGGGGGIDSQVVAFRATPGEHVSVGGGGGGITINNNIDARGATADLIQALPAVLRQNNERLKADIIDTLGRSKVAWARR